MDTSEKKWDKSHMMSMDEIDPDKFPTLFKYWQAVRKNPFQKNLPKWMVANKKNLDKEISLWNKGRNGIQR
jgi:hypothetical protein